MEQPSNEFLVVPDPELTFFRNVMKLRENEIQHVHNDAIKFYKERYGLDFSQSPLNDQGELFYENATAFLYRFRENPHFNVVFNNWIQTGNTRYTCEEVIEGGYLVIFTGEQLLHGTYGGREGKKTDQLGSILYSYNIISVCDQSPIVIQIQNEVPFRQEPNDRSCFINYDAYNTVLGYGKAYGSALIEPDREIPGTFRYNSRIVFNFPAE